MILSIWVVSFLIETAGFSLCWDARQGHAGLRVPFFYDGPGFLRFPRRQQVLYGFGFTSRVLGSAMILGLLWSATHNTNNLVFQILFIATCWTLVALGADGAGWLLSRHKFQMMNWAVERIPIINRWF